MFEHGELFSYDSPVKAITFSERC